MIVAKHLTQVRLILTVKLIWLDTNATGMSGLYFKYGKKTYGSISFDNIEIFSADQYTE